MEANGKEQESPDVLLSWLKIWAWERGRFIVIPLVLIFIAFFFWPKLEIPEVIIKGDDGKVQERAQTLYLLSAIAQALAAVFALVFTISLVIVQLSSKYSHRILSRFFEVGTILYIILFILSVLLPLWLLAKPFPTGVRFSLFLAAVCLFGLIPYFLQLRQALDPEFQINKLHIDALNRLNRNSEVEPMETATMDNFIMSAFVFKDYDTFEHGVNKLSDFMLKAAQNDSGPAWNPDRNISGLVSKRLRNIGVATIEDPRAPLQVIKAFGQAGVDALRQIDVVNQKMIKFPGWICIQLEYIGLKTVEKKLDEITEIVANYLFDNGTTAIEKRHTLEVYSVANSLKEIGIKALEQDLRRTLSISISKKLLDISHAAFKKNFNKAEISEVISEKLKDMCIVAIEKNQSDVATSISTCLKDIGIENMKEGSIELQKAARTVQFHYLYRIIIKAEDKNLWELVKGISDHIKQLCKVGADYNMWEMVEYGSNCLIDICKRAHVKEEKSTVRYLASQITHFGALATNKENEVYKTKIKNRLKHLDSVVGPEIINSSFNVFETMLTNPDLSLGDALIEFESFYKE